MNFLGILKKYWKLTTIIIVACILILFQVDFLMILTVELWLVLLLISVRDFAGNIFFTVFLCSFFVFLISGDLAEQIFHIYYYRQFEADAVMHARISIVLSIIFLTIGFIRKQPKKQPHTVLEHGTQKLNILKESAQTISKSILCVTYPILVFDTINQILFVVANGYVAYYTSYDSLLPSIFLKLGEMTHAALCIYLATFPKKKETKIVLLLYLIYAVMGMIVGQRGAFIYRFAFVLAYFILRTKVHNDGEVWIKKHAIILILAAAPFMLAFLFIYDYIRTGNDVPKQTIGEMIANFFVNIGSTSQVIKDGYVYDAAIPRTKIFSLGGIINYFKYSKLFNLFNSEAIPVPHTAEFALQGHRFDSLISYLRMEEKYLAGHGAGSCFIAELFADFGYLGICAGSYIYGLFFKTLSKLKRKNWLSCAVLLYMMMNMIQAPRSAYDSFLSVVVNVIYICFVIVIVVLSKMQYDGLLDKIYEKVKTRIFRHKQP